MTKHNLPIKERFMLKVSPEPTSGCWLWTAKTSIQGYGQFKVGKSVKLAHRVSWEIHNGPIPKSEGFHGTCVLHKCDVCSCVNPDHLFLGTHTDNMQDMLSKGREGKCFGEDMPTAKLSEFGVRIIKRLIQGGNLNQVQIGGMFGVSKNLICRIKKGKAWVHI